MDINRNLHVNIYMNFLAWVKSCMSTNTLQSTYIYICFKWVAGVRVSLSHFHTNKFICTRINGESRLLQLKLSVCVYPSHKHSPFFNMEAQSDQI